MIISGIWHYMHGIYYAALQLQVGYYTICTTLLCRIIILSGMTWIRAIITISEIWQQMHDMDHAAL